MSLAALAGGTRRQPETFKGSSRQLGFHSLASNTSGSCLENVKPVDDTFASALLPRREQFAAIHSTLGSTLEAVRVLVPNIGAIPILMSDSGGASGCVGGGMGRNTFLGVSKRERQHRVWIDKLRHNSKTLSGTFDFISSFGQ